MKLIEQKIITCELPASTAAAAASEAASAAALAAVSAASASVSTIEETGDAADPPPLVDTGEDGVALSQVVAGAEQEGPAPARAASRRAHRQRPPEVYPTRLSQRVQGGSLPLWLCHHLVVGDRKVD